MVLVLLNELLELIKRDLVILNNEVDLELLDTEADGDPLGSTPGKTVHLDLLDTLEELLKISLIIPRLDVKGDKRLGGGLGALSGLLGGVVSESLLLDLLGLLINLVIVRAEEIDIIVVLLLSGGGSGGSVSGNLLGGTGESRLVLLGSNVLEPSSGVGVLLGVRGRRDGLVNGNVSLRSGSAIVSKFVWKQKRNFTDRSGKVNMGLSSFSGVLLPPQ